MLVQVPSRHPDGSIPSLLNPDHIYVLDRRIHQITLRIESIDPDPMTDIHLSLPAILPIISSHRLLLLIRTVSRKTKNQ